MEKKCVLSGYAIVVLDRGWVYVGETEISGEWCNITNAKNIRRWGTKNGLGQLAAEGPQAETVLDGCVTLRAPIRAVISVIDTEAKKWVK